MSAIDVTKIKAPNSDPAESTAVTKMERIQQTLYNHIKPIRIGCFSASALTGTAALALGSILYVPAVGTMIPIPVLMFMGSHFTSFEIGLTATIGLSVLLCAAGIGLQFLQAPNSARPPKAKNTHKIVDKSRAGDPSTSKKEHTAFGRTSLAMFQLASNILDAHNQVEVIQQAGIAQGMGEEEASEWARLVQRNLKQNTMPAAGFSKEQLALEAKKEVFKKIYFSDAAKAMAFAHDKFLRQQPLNARNWAEARIAKFYKANIEQYDKAQEASELTIPPEGVTDQQISDWFYRDHSEFTLRGNQEQAGQACAYIGLDKDGYMARTLGIASFLYRTVADVPSGENDGERNYDFIQDSLSAKSE